MTPSIARTQLTADYSIPKIINGGWQLATGHALAHALDMKDAHNAFAELLDRGFDTFDCADIYTGVEAFYGQIIAERRRAGLSLPQIHTKFVPDLKDLAHVDRAYVERVIERSLSRLGVERLDMVQFHWWDYDVPGMIDTAGELMRLQERDSSAASRRRISTPPTSKSLWMPAFPSLPISASIRSSTAARKRP